MANSATYELAILLSLRDAASGRLDRFGDKLRATGKESRAALQDFESLRKGIGRDLAIGGVGVVTLKMLKNGVDAAGDYESAVLDLKSAYQEASTAGSVSATEQAAQLIGLSKLSKGLGNDLMGNTGNYTEIMVALKKAGLDTTTVLNGAGKSAAYLANVSGALLEGRAAQQAKQLGQFGIMFKLKPEEFEKQVNLFSALKDRFDIDSDQLIESAKYFQSTANSIKLSGFAGAEETSKFFALIKRTGALEGSQAGTSATSFFQQFIAQADKRAKIKKATGLDIKLFDKKGEFLGLENAFTEMEKFRKFSSEKRLELLNAIFGEQGGKVAGIMAESGAEGWRNVSKEAAKAVPVQEKINQQMATYNAKMEAIAGTLDNIKATTFTPLLGTAKPALDRVSSLLGKLQEFGEANPRVASVTSHIIGVGAVALTAYSGIRMMTTGWRLWRIASTVGAAESGLLAFLKRTQVEAAATGTAIQRTAAIQTTARKAAAIPALALPTQATLPFLMEPRAMGPVQGQLAFMTQTTAAANTAARAVDNVTTKTGRLRSALNSLPPRITSTVNLAGSNLAGAARDAGNLTGRLAALDAVGQIGITIAVTYTLTKAFELGQVIAEANAAEEGARQATANNLSSLARLKASYAARGEQVPSDIYRSQAASALHLLTAKDKYKEYISGRDATRDFFGDAMNRTHGRTFNMLNSISRGLTLQPQNPFMSWGGWDTKMAAGTMRQKMPELGQPEIMGEFLKLMRQNFKPEEVGQLNKSLEMAFPESFKQATTQLSLNFQTLAAQTMPLEKALTGILLPAESVPKELTKTSDALGRFASRVNNLRIEVQPIQVPSIVAPQAAPGAQPQGGFKILPDGISSFKPTGLYRSPSSLRGVDDSAFNGGNLLRTIDQVRTVQASSGLTRPMSVAPAGEIARSGGGHTHYHSDLYHINVNPPPGSRMAEESAAFMEELNHLVAVKRERV